MFNDGILCQPHGRKKPAEGNILNKLQKGETSLYKHSMPRTRHTASVQIQGSLGEDMLKKKTHWKLRDVN